MSSPKLILNSLAKANLLHSKSSLLFLLLYLTAGGAVFGACAYFGILYQEAIYEAVLGYVFPVSWHGAADLLFDFFFESQSKIVVAGMLSSAALVMASILLFPLKEKCSALYEQAMGAPHGEGKELALWVQGLEESKLVLLYVTSQMVILAIGYYPFLYTKILSEVLSVVFLSFTFGIDFIAPTLQRHGVKYNAVLRLLLRRFFSTLLWGAAYGLPVLYIGKYLLSYSELTLIEVSAAVFGVSLIALSLAIASGTYLASALLSESKEIKPLSSTLRKRAYGVVCSLFVVGLIFHGSVFASLHHKTQVLKMQYSIDWDKLDFKMDSLLSMLKDQGDIAISFPLQVRNPTEFDFELEDSFVIVRQEDREVANMAISHLQVPSGETVYQQMQADIQISGASLSGFRGLMTGWTAYIEYEVLPGIPFIVKII